MGIIRARFIDLQPAIARQRAIDRIRQTHKQRRRARQRNAAAGIAAQAQIDPAIPRIELCRPALAFEEERIQRKGTLPSVDNQCLRREPQGIRADLIQTLCFSITGAIFAVATIDMLAQQNQTSATTGPGTEITCLTAAIIGGISMKGGKGNVVGMVAGIFVMQIISNGMMLAGWGTYTQYTVKGLILMAAIAFDALKSRPKPMVRVRKDAPAATK